MIFLDSRDHDRVKSCKAMTVAVLLAGLAALSLPAAGAEGPDISEVIAQCAACHGPEGIARDVEIPNLAGQHDRYLVTQLKNFRSGKRPHKEMAYMSRHITDEEIEAIARYYAQIPH
ncbi:MAG: c-type cytochrome [Methylocystis sp.]